MIEKTDFASAWRSLCRRFNRDLDTNEMLEYHEYLDGKLTTEEFRVAARDLWASREFFPRPDDFVAAGKGSPEAQAIEDWRLCQFVMEGSTTALAKMTEAGRRTVALMGGMDELRNTPLDQVHFRRREFLKLHGDAQEIHRRESHTALPPMSADSRKLIENAVPKLLAQGKES